MAPPCPSWETVGRYGTQIDTNRWYSNFEPLVCEFERRSVNHFGGDVGIVVTRANVGPFGMDVDVDRRLRLRSPIKVEVIIDAAVGFDTATLFQASHNRHSSRNESAGCGEAGFGFLLGIDTKCS